MGGAWSVASAAERPDVATVGEGGARGFCTACGRLAVCRRCRRAGRRFHYKDGRIRAGVPRGWAVGGLPAVLLQVATVAPQEGSGTGAVCTTGWRWVVGRFRCHACRRRHCKGEWSQARVYRGSAMGGPSALPPCAPTLPQRGQLEPGGDTLRVVGGLPAASAVMRGDAFTAGRDAAGRGGDRLLPAGGRPPLPPCGDTLPLRGWVERGKAGTVSGRWAIRHPCCCAPRRCHCGGGWSRGKVLRGWAVGGRTPPPTCASSGAWGRRRVRFLCPGAFTASAVAAVADTGACHAGSTPTCSRRAQKARGAPEPFWWSYASAAADWHTSSSRAAGGGANWSRQSSPTAHSRGVRRGRTGACTWSVAP